MNESASRSRQWILVKVWRGIPSGIEVWNDLDQAVRREVELRKSLPPEDEVALFEKPTGNPFGQTDDPVLLSYA